VSLRPAELGALAERIRELPGVRAKSAIGTVADVLGGGDWWAGPGDDGAVVEDDGRLLVVGGGVEPDRHRRGVDRRAQRVDPATVRRRAERGVRRVGGEATSTPIDV